MEVMDATSVCLSVCPLLTILVYPTRDSPPLTYFLLLKNFQRICARNHTISSCSKREISVSLFSVIRVLFLPQSNGDLHLLASSDFSFQEHPKQTAT